MIELAVEQEKTGWRFVVSEGGEQIACMRADKHDDRVAIHTDIDKWGKDYLRVYRQMFYDVRGYLREQGIRLLIPCTDQPDSKIQKFWRLMGFRFFHEYSHQGKTLYLAVMEA